MTEDPPSALRAFTTPLLEEVKMKILGWLTKFEPETPKTNLTPQAIRGKKWITDAVVTNEIFVTKADKGGSILILDKFNRFRDIANFRKYGTLGPCG